MAISSCSKLFINTDCFNQVLNRIWYNRLLRTDKSFFGIVKFTISFLTFGLLAPYVMSYCPAEGVGKDNLPDNVHNDVHQVGLGEIYAFLKTIIL